MHTGFWWGNLRERDHLEDRKGEDNIKMDLQEVCLGGMDWIDMAQNRDRWRALVNAVMKLRAPLNAGNFLTGNRLASQEGLCCMELMILTLIVYSYCHNFYCNVNCNVDRTGENTTHVLRLTCLYFILAVCLVQKPDDRLVN